MTDRRTWLKTLGAAGAAAAAGGAAQETERQYWLRQLGRLAHPVLDALARGELKRRMPVECAPGQEESRRKVTHLEALGRLLAGIAPWLEATLPPGPEEDARRSMAETARAAIAMAVDPGSPDFLNFSEDRQPLVDCGFLAQALVRAPRELVRKLDERTRKNLAAALAASRAITPGYSNWLMFSALVETGLSSLGERWDAMRIDYAIRKHLEWYCGDGVYGDGPQFHFDYYNSFVIQPMLVDTLLGIAPHSEHWKQSVADVMARARRYAAIQERLIAPDGSYPAVGRSICYRCGAFQVLAQMALLGQLPDPLSGPRVRAALTAVMRRTLDAPGTFDDQGWLRIGLCGHQPHLGEGYISTGSLYLCSVALLPLGLAHGDLFWAGTGEDWTSRRIWRGENMAADHAI